MGPSINHVVKFLGIFDPPPPSWPLLQNKAYVLKWSFGYPPPPPLQLSTWFMNDPQQQPKYQTELRKEVRLSLLRLHHVKRESWDRLFRSGGSHFIYCSLGLLPENLC